jgi:ribosomal protein S18 acetylase RimI-like enzyme
MLKSSTAVLATQDIVATIDFYKSILGFGASWTWGGEPPTFGSASCGGVTLMFILEPELAKVVEGHQHWIVVEDIDSLYAQHLEKGAPILEPIEDKSWGFREYTVVDPSGYHLRFAEEISLKAQPSAPFPEGVRIERRLPTSDEYRAVAGREFYQGNVLDGILEHSWSGAVALDPANRVVGTVRIMQDAPGWFSIWDVAVLPDWQGQRIGSEMMKDAMAAIQEASPGANVFLFTYKHEFYERFGFAKETVSMRRL